MARLLYALRLRFFDGDEAEGGLMSQATGATLNRCTCLSAEWCGWARTPEFLFLSIVNHHDGS